MAPLKSRTSQGESRRRVKAGEGGGKGEREKERKVRAPYDKRGRYLKRRFTRYRNYGRRPEHFADRIARCRCRVNYQRSAEIINAADNDHREMGKHRGKSPIVSSSHSFTGLRMPRGEGLGNSLVYGTRRSNNARFPSFRHSKWNS